jgi:Fic family protein
LSRVLTTLLLLQAGYSYVPYRSLESVIEANEEGSYLGLRWTQGTLTHDEPDFEPWLIFFVRSLKKQKDRLAEKVAREPGAEGLHPDALKILEEARRTGRITTGAAEKLTGAKRPMVKTRLAELVKRRFLVRQGLGRVAWYGLPPR